MSVRIGLPAAAPWAGRVRRCDVPAISVAPLLSVLVRAWRLDACRAAGLQFRGDGRLPGCSADLVVLSRSFIMALFGNSTSFGAPQQTLGNTAAAAPSGDVEVSQPPPDGISALAFSSAADFLAASSWDNAVRRSAVRFAPASADCLVGAGLWRRTEREHSSEGHVPARGAGAGRSVEQGWLEDHLRGRRQGCTAVRRAVGPGAAGGRT